MKLRSLAKILAGAAIAGPLLSAGSAAQPPGGGRPESAASDERVAACRAAHRDERSYCRERGGRIGHAGSALPEGPGSYKCLEARMRVDRQCFVSEPAAPSDPGGKR